MRWPRRRCRWHQQRKEERRDRERRLESNLDQPESEGIFKRESDVSQWKMLDDATYDRQEVGKGVRLSIW